MAAPMTSNVTDLCRLCGTDTLSIVRHPIFEADGVSRRLANKITECLPVVVTEQDRLPKIMCGECVYKLDLLSEFRNNVVKTEHLLESLVDGVKPEIIENEEHDDDFGADDDFRSSSPELEQNEPEVLIKEEEALPVKRPRRAAAAAAAAAKKPGKRGRKRKQTEGVAEEAPTKAAKRSVDEEQLPEKPREPKKRGRKPKDHKESAGGAKVLLDRIKEEAVADLTLDGDAPALETLDALTCDACLKAFHTLPDLRRHLRSHAKRITNRPSACPYCKLRFPLRSAERRNHIEREHPATHRCVQCEYQARSPLELQEHFEARHTLRVRVRREFHCALCPGRKAYLKRRSMREHFQRRHLLLNVCAHCGRAHGSPAALLVHERLHTGERPYVCEMCGRAYHNASSLNMHKHAHHRNDATRRPPQDRLQCQLCHERFLTLEGVREHLESTHGVMRDAARDRGFECEVCHKRFTALQTMRDHMLLHRGERPHECHICRKRFTTRSVRNKHVLVVHQGVDERRFACSACGKRFVNRHKLTVHERLHTGERPFTCDVCNKTYTNASRVKEHKMAVHKIMPYKCDKCAREFKVGSELRLHQLVHAQLAPPPPPPPQQQLQV